MRHFSRTNQPRRESDNLANCSIVCRRNHSNLCSRLPQPEHLPQAQAVEDDWTEVEGLEDLEVRRREASFHPLRDRRLLRRLRRLQDGQRVSGQRTLVVGGSITQLTVNVQYNFLPVTGFEPRTSGIGSDHSTK